jgi:hypothetical protein
MARAARAIPPAEAITTKAVLPVLPETDTLLPSESKADVATSMTPIVELGAFVGAELTLGESERTGAPLTRTGLTGAVVGMTGAVVGMIGTFMDIDMDIDKLIDMEKKRRPSSSARARKSLTPKEGKSGQGMLIVRQHLIHMPVSYISVSAISWARPDSVVLPNSAEAYLDINPTQTTRKVTADLILKIRRSEDDIEALATIL